MDPLVVEVVRGKLEAMESCATTARELFEGYLANIEDGEVRANHRKRLLRVLKTIGESQAGLVQSVIEEVAE